jgi:hypothetical protein
MIPVCKQRLVQDLILECEKLLKYITPDLPNFGEYVENVNTTRDILEGRVK